MSQENFKKFIRPKNNAAIKEKFRQEKKAAKKERAESINRRFEEKRTFRNTGHTAEGVVPVNTFGSAKKKYHGAKTVNRSIEKSSGIIKKESSSSGAQMPLNKFIAHCGITSRREAVALIKEGKVKVNNSIITEPGHKVNDKDVIIYNGKRLFPVKNLVYILLNKPKDYITTTDDPQGRKTVLQLIKQATSERVYPVGRLDRNTSGVLLFTNDGEFTQKLTHPGYNVKKIYEVKLDKPLTRTDFDKILKGLRLEDGEIHADALAYADARDRSVIGIEIHSGRNRIVRRIFEHLGYSIRSLDRVMYANLTKKNVERGKWRYLNEKEVRQLKFMTASSYSKVQPKEPTT